MAASRLGLSLRCRTTRLVLCCECGSYRSAVDKRHGKCRVCRMRDQLQGREWACGEEMARMTPEQRDVYERNESRRGTKPSSLGPRPVLGESCVLSRYERQKAKTAYLLALEEWEYRRLMLPYDAAKKRLQRMREVTGTNPRKSKK